ncbi:MAG TPA: hypothetical protein VHA52_00575, partial [Candidatus Babeliaceae bacterium]|nr:hypothetical protein [Candidatus Babeliaceae bacterium]
KAADVEVIRFVPEPRCAHGLIAEPGDRTTADLEITLHVLHGLVQTAGLRHERGRIFNEGVMRQLEHERRLFDGRRLLETVIKKYDIKRFKLAKPYLCYVQGDPQQFTDQNYIILQESIQDARVLEDDPETLQSLQEGDIKELFLLIIHGGLWNIKRNILVKGDYLYLVDLEQPSTSSPADFFRKKASHNACAQADGLKEAGTLLGKGSYQWDILRELIRNEKSLQSSSYWNDLQQFFTL